MTEQKKESPFSNLLFNIVIPALILMKFSSEDRLGPTYGLIVALAFPIVYFLYDYIKNKNKNFISILGFVSILLTGGIGLLELPTSLYAIKEALIPFLIAIAVIISNGTKYSVFDKLLYRPEVFEVEKINALLKNNGSEAEFHQRTRFANFFLASSFLLSAILNYVLATIIVKSPSGTIAFNDEVARMTMLSYPVIVVPSMIILALVFYFFIRDIKRLTGLKLEEMIAVQEKHTKKD